MRILLLTAVITIMLLLSCSHDEFPLPTIPVADSLLPSYTNPEYIQINPPLDEANGYNFSNPADIYYGVDNFLYIADTDNNRIVMMDLGGTIQGYSQQIDHPEAVTQNDSLQLLVVNNTNAVYKIDLYNYNHQISQAPVEQVFVQESEPSRQFTGITVHNGFEYYVSVIDVEPGRSESFVYDFRGNNFLKGPLPLEINGSGLFSVMLPTAIVSIREQFLDLSARAEDNEAFFFTQIGSIPEQQLQSFYKVQHITTTVVEGQNILVPNFNLIGTDLYNFEKFSRPEDIALDRSGFIFIVDAGAADADSSPSAKQPGFYRFSPTGIQLQAVLSFGNGVKQFNNPKGIAVTPISEEDQFLYIADTGNNRILIFQLSTDV